MRGVECLAEGHVGRPHSCFTALLFPGCCNMREGLRGDFNEKSSSELERCSVKVHMAIMRRATSLPAGGESLSVSCSCSYFGIFSCLSLFSSVPQWSVKSHGGLRPSTSPPPVSISTERGGKKSFSEGILVTHLAQSHANSSLNTVSWSGVFYI